ncbi:MAG: helix-turn-helix transcriptional regulator [Ruminococcaceae bacterium]|nr:helix-turn-helix transcriptional regulator [Oscillospiraceae bacterium]
MESKSRNLFHIILPGMEAFLASCFFCGMLDRPRNKHVHPCYELICIENGEEMSFTIVPPLFEHVMADAPTDKVSSILFSFLQEEIKDICMRLKSISEPVTIRDNFEGLERIRSVKQLALHPVPGAREQIAAELRLLFIGLARNVWMQEEEYEDVQTLEEERLAHLEEYFNIKLKDADCSKQQLAEQLGVCERQLTRILKETYQSSFSTILLRSRMNLAQAMVEQGKKSIEEIAESVGYTSPQSFKRAYRKFFGHLPVKKQIKT